MATLERRDRNGSYRVIARTIPRRWGYADSEIRPELAEKYVEQAAQSLQK
jgi:hypothetical protein